MIKRILVGIADRMYTVAATKHALEIAKVSEAAVTGISVLDVAAARNIGPVAIGAGQLAKELREQRIQQTEEVIRDSFDAFVRLADDAGIDYSRKKVGGDPMGAIIDASRYYDLVVVGLHCLFEHGLLDEPPDALVKLVSAGVYPMLAVSEKFRPIHRILVAYSGSIESARSMRCFVHHQQLWPDAEIKIVSFGKTDADGQSHLTKAGHYMEAHGIVPDIEYVKGPSNLLLNFADGWNADMIVLGNSAKNLLRRKIFGETALQTIREARIPLFLSQ